MLPSFDYILFKWNYELIDSYNFWAAYDIPICQDIVYTDLCPI